ncbi:hypothetical protein [Jatrophihabitans fulvus]
MEFLAPDMLEKPALEVQKAMSKDVRAAAKKLNTSPGFFVVADDVPLKDKKSPFFVVVKTEAEAKDWVLKVKGKKPRVVLTGQCKLQMAGADVSVSLTKVTGDRVTALKALKLAFRMDPTVKLPDLEEKKPGEAGAGAAKPAATSLSISPTVDAMVAKVPEKDRTEIAGLLKEFEGLGLSEQDLKDALKETFARK